METDSINKSIDTSKFDFRDFLKNCRARWWWFAVSVVCFGTLGILYSLYFNQKYAVEANIMIKPEGGSQLGLIAASFDIGGMFGGGAMVDDEMMMVSSYTIMLKTVKDLGLNTQYVVKKNLIERKPEPEKYPLELVAPSILGDTISNSLFFKVSVTDKGLASVKVKELKYGNIVNKISDAKLPLTVKTPHGTFILRPTKYFVKGKSLRENIIYHPYSAAAQLLQKEVSISIPNRKANAIQLSMRTPTPGFGMKILDAIVANYEARQMEQSRNELTKTAEFIETRLQSLTGELDSSEASIEAFKKANKLTDLTADATYIITKMGELETQLTTAETGLAITKMTRAFVADPANKHALIPVPNAQTEQTGAIGQYNNLLLERMKLATNAKPDNPQLQLLDSQIEAMRENILTSLDRSVRNNQVAVDKLRAESNSNQSRIGNLPSNERQYINIKRQQTIKENIFVYLLQLREETNMNIANAKPNFKTIDTAHMLITPVGLTKKMIYVIFFFLGFACPAKLIYARMRLRNKFSTREELERMTRVPVIGEISRDKKNNGLVMIEDENSVTAELFRLARTNLQFLLSNPSDKVVLMTSSSEGEGKTFVAINLAMSLSLVGKKVLLIDMDIRKPKVKEYLGINQTKGLTEYLTSGDIKLEDIINRNVRTNGFDVITSGPVPPNPSELLSSEKISHMIESVQSQYDYIIIDTAPVGKVSDPLILNRFTDMTIYVCRADYTKKDNIRFLDNLYVNKRLKRLALIINDTEKNASVYGYGR